MADGKYTYAVGRRKTSTAIVRLYKGAGDNLLNGKKVEEFFSSKIENSKLMKPFVATNTIGEYHFEATVNGGGRSGWIDAIRLGVARAFVKADESFKPMLKVEGLMTRDPRMKERKKIFTRGARRGKQFSKR